MARKKITEKYTICSQCRKVIKKQFNGKGYCESCKREIMRQWNNVPFDTRIEVLEQLKYSRKVYKVRITQ